MFGRERRPRVLYLSFFFPPSRASGVYRGRATANHLAYQGWDVTVCAAPLRFLYEAIGSVDEELTSTVDRRIRVVRPALSLFPWEHDVRRFGRFRGSMPIVARRLYQWGQARVFPEPYGSWGLSAVARAVRMHARRRFDVVLATGNPFASFAAAWLFHKLTGVPYVVDYRDSWTLNLFTDAPAFPDDHPAWRWEKRVLSHAAGVVFVNEALRGWHAQRYPRAADKMMVVPNGWDADLMSPPAEPAAHPGGPLRFGYLGTLTGSQPVEELAAAFRRARRHPELADAELNIHGHLGFFRNSPAELMTRLGLTGDDPNDPNGPNGDPDDRAGGDSGIVYRGPVSKTEVGAVYQHSDVLVFLAGGGRYVTSGKIFEYMAAGRPIVSVHAPDIAATEVLAGYPLWFTANSLDVDGIAQTMIAAGKAARDLTPAQHTMALDHANGFARHNLLAPFEHHLHSLIKRRTTATPGPAGSVVPPPSKQPVHPPAPTPPKARPASERVSPRVLLIAFNHVPSERVTNYADYLVGQGVGVDLVVVDRRRVQGLSVDSRVRVHPLLKAESGQPLRRIERLVVHRIPGATLAATRRLLAGQRLTRPLAAPLVTLERWHLRLSEAFSRRIFHPAYRSIRPWLLSRPSRKALRAIDIAGVERIVAADLSAVALAWRLARRHRAATATTILDRKPYADREPATTGHEPVTAAAE
jgi:glycosyltransferase involved in cell wall biosynthesis